MYNDPRIAFNVVNNEELKLRVRLEILNYFNDSRPLVLHQIFVKDTFTTTPPTMDCDIRPIFIKLFRVIDILKGVLIESSPLSFEYSFIPKQEYIPLGNDKVYIVDLEFTTYPHLYRRLCVKGDCNSCLEIKITKFRKIQTLLSLVVDKPDPNDNTKVLYDVVETLKF